MNRRDFLRRAGLVAAGAVVADKLELLDMLAPRRLFPSVGLTEATFEFTQSNARYQLDGVSDSGPLTMARLREAYRRTTTQLYRTYTRRIDEYDWMDSIDGRIVASGRENVIPLEYAQWNREYPHTTTRDYDGPQWRTGYWGRPRRFRYPKEFSRLEEPRFVRELRHLIQSELPDPAINPNSRPRFMREFDKLWQRSVLNA